MGIGSYVRARKAVKASRASLEGIAGHQAAMKGYRDAALSSSQASVGAWVKPESVRDPNSINAKIESQRSRGLITDNEARDEKFEGSLKDYVDKGKDAFEPGLMKPVAQYQAEKGAPLNLKVKKRRNAAGKAIKQLKKDVKSGRKFNEEEDN